MTVSRSGLAVGLAFLLLLLLPLLFVASGVLLAMPFRRAVAPPPADLGVETVTIPSRSGSLLHGWLVRGEPGSGAVVLLHGIHSDRSTMLARMRFLRDAGYSVLAIDFQAQGESSGKFITFGRLEALDAAAAVAFTRERFPQERVGAIGESLGGAAALLGPAPLEVDALILESVYPDIRSAIANRIALHLGATAGRFLASAYLELMPLIIRVHEEELRPIDRIARLRAPLLLMAGTMDRYTAIEESRALFERAPEPKQFWAVSGAAHVDLAQYAPTEYRSRVLAYFSEHLRAHASPAPTPR
jgi:uncharacterized protein